MKRNKILLTVIFLSVWIVSFAQPQKVVADKIIAVVGNKIVLKSDVENSILDMQRQGIDIPADAKCLVLQQSMGLKALVLQAEKDSLPITDEEIDADIENRVRYFINQYGSKEELEKVAGKSIYQLKEDFKESVRDQKLAAAMRNKVVDEIKITPNEVKVYFEKIPADSLAYYESELEVGQIVVYPKASREAEEYCIEQLNEYKKQAEAGKDFGTLASVNSEDPGSKANGGRYEINRSQKDLDPTWLSKAFSLKEGQISSPFKSRFGYHIIKLESRLGDDAVVRHILKIPQVTQFEMKAGLQRLDSVRAKLIAATMDFGSAVSKYSDDDLSKFTGGMLQGKNGTFLTIDELDKDLVGMLKDLKVGEYSQPVAYTDDRGKQGVRIVYLKTKTDPHRENLKDDYDKVAQRALEEKKEAALEKWFDAHIKTYYVKLDNEYKDCEVLKKWQAATDAASIKK